MSDNQGIAKGEPHPEPEQDEPQSCVVVLAYTSSDGQVEEDFGKYVQDIKALYTFKQDVRAYLLVEQAAKNVLAKVEKPKGEPTNKAILVISFDQLEDSDAATQKLHDIVQKVRGSFEDEADVEVNVAIREVADEVLGVFKVGA